MEQLAKIERIKQQKHLHKMNANPKHYFVDCSNILKFYWFLIGET
jgi:hypothetical protein